MEKLEQKYHLSQEYVDVVNELGDSMGMLEYEYAYADGDTTTYDGTFYNRQLLLEHVGNGFQFYNYFEDVENEFAGRFSEKEGLTIQEAAKAFCFGGLGDGGHLIFHPVNNSVWLIYPDGYVEKLDDSFAGFREKAEIEATIKSEGLHYKVTLVSAANKLETIKLLKTYIATITSIEAKKMVDNLPCLIMNNVPYGIDDNVSCLIIDKVYYKLDVFKKQFEDIGAMVEIEQYFE